MKKFALLFLVFLTQSVLCFAQFDFSGCQTYSTKSESKKYPLNISFIVPNGWISAPAKSHPAQIRVFSKVEDNGLVNSMLIALFEVSESLFPKSYTQGDLRRDFVSKDLAEDLSAEDDLFREVLDHKVISNTNPIVVEFANKISRYGMRGYSANYILLFDGKYMVFLKYSLFSSEKIWREVTSKRSSSMESEFAERRKSFQKIYASLKVENTDGGLSWGIGSINDDLYVPSYLSANRSGGSLIKRNDFLESLKEEFEGKMTNNEPLDKLCEGTNLKRTNDFNSKVSQNFSDKDTKFLETLKAYTPPPKQPYSHLLRFLDDVWPLLIVIPLLLFFLLALLIRIKSKRKGIYTLDTCDQVDYKMKAHSENRYGKWKLEIVLFILGMFVGAFLMYILFNRYVSYPSQGSRIVRLDKLTGKISVANAQYPSRGWIEIE